jgi:hypothetical protein
MGMNSQRHSATQGSPYEIVYCATGTCTVVYEAEDDIFIIFHTSYLIMIVGQMYKPAYHARLPHG